MTNQTSWKVEDIFVAINTHATNVGRCLINSTWKRLMSCEFKPSYFSSLLAIENLQNRFFFEFLVFNFYFWRNSAREKNTKRRCPACVPEEKRARSFLSCMARATFPLFFRNEDSSLRSWKNREAPGDGAQLPFHRLYKISLSFILRHRAPFPAFFSNAVELFDLELLCWILFNKSCILFWPPISIFEVLDRLFLYFFGFLGFTVED